MWDLRKRTVFRKYPKERRAMLRDLETIEVTTRIPADRPQAFDVGQQSTRASRQGQLVAAGGRCNPLGGAPITPGCYRTGQNVCDFQRCPGQLQNQAAGAAFGPIVIVPTNTQYFQPIAAECLVTENADPAVNGRVRFTAFEIAGTPQEPFHTIPALAGTLAAVWSDHFLPGDFGPRPVSWGIFSVAALTKPLQIYGWQAHLNAVDIAWLIYGNAADALPTGMRVGEPYI